MGRKKIAADETPQQRRVKWLLDNHYGGSQTEMSKKTGVSLTGITKVVSGQQDPGRRLLETIVQNTEVNPTWLLTGEGPPFRGSGIPVAPACLPGPPKDHCDQLGDEPVTEVANLYSPTRYWLKLQSNEPAVRFRGSTFVAGDLLLMEADRSQFPAPDQLSERWGVIRTPAPKGFQPRLARLSYSPAGGDGEPAVLEAETFEHHPTFGTRVLLELIPGAEPRVSVNEVRYEQPSATAQSERGESPKRHGISLLPRGVEVTDVIALCVLVVRRFR